MDHKLKETRKQYNISIRALATLTGMSTRTINKIELGVGKPTKSTRILISMVLSELSGNTISPEDLFDYKKLS